MGQRASPRKKKAPAHLLSPSLPFGEATKKPKNRKAGFFLPSRGIKKKMAWSVHPRRGWAHTGFPPVRAREVGEAGRGI